MDIRLNGRVLAPGEGIEALRREQGTALQSDRSTREKFPVDTCQCCGARERPGQTCVCDGLDWYMLPGGGVECQAHRFARAIDPAKKKFFFLRGSK